MNRRVVAISHHAGRLRLAVRADAVAAITRRPPRRGRLAEPRLLAFTWTEDMGVGSRTSGGRLAGHCHTPPPRAFLVGAVFRAVIAIPGMSQFHTSRHHPGASWGLRRACHRQPCPRSRPVTPRGWPVGATFASRGFRDSEFSGVGAPSSQRVEDPLPANRGRVASSPPCGRAGRQRPDHHHTPTGQSPDPEENQR